MNPPVKTRPPRLLGEVIRRGLTPALGRAAAARVVRSASALYVPPPALARTRAGRFNVRTAAYLLAARDALAHAEVPARQAEDLLGDHLPRDAPPAPPGQRRGGTDRTPNAGPQLPVSGGCISRHQTELPSKSHVVPVAVVHGQVSVAELHWLTSRMNEAKRAAARRGELRVPLPVGLVYDDDGGVGMDPR